MATFINRLCPNPTCESHKIKRSDDQPHKALCQVKGMRDDGDKGSAYWLECGDCKQEFSAPTVKEKIMKMSYSKGYYCASTDQTFDSYSSQKAYEVKHKLDPL